MIRVSVVGASGYTAAELFRLLSQHRVVKIVDAYALKNAGKRVSDVHPGLRGIVDMVIREVDYDRISKNSDLVFTAVPHKVPMTFVPRLLDAGVRVVDLSADYRFEDVRVYEKMYVKHESPDVKGVYGLPELHRTKIKKANLVANPGCFPTAAVLSLAPLVKKALLDLDHISIDAKTGTSGAGATPSEATHHPTIGANVRAYSVLSHRHAPEIDQELSRLAGRSVRVGFAPHLVPIVRGILSTAHVFLKKDMSKDDLIETYRKFYSGEPFVRVLDSLPETNYVYGSNYCDIGLEVDGEGRAVIVAAIDNLVKGASGQAVQNMNIMFGVDETEGLRFAPLRP
ncbi:MAG: N-acetyl-gamma-glutamyl-phosphate reductase [Candidatus Hadarchaeales archaeon]